MALSPLASVADLTLRGVDTSDSSLVAEALAVASSAIRDAAGVSISEETSSVTVSATGGRFLPLPGPVSAVTAVTVDGDTVTDYTVLPNGLWRRAGWSDCGDPVPVVVSMTFGYAEVPDDIVDLCCQLAKDWLADPAAPSGKGVTSVRVDDAGETYDSEHVGRVSAVQLPKVTRDWLAARFSGGAFVVETL